MNTTIWSVEPDDADLPAIDVGGETGTDGRDGDAATRAGSRTAGRRRGFATRVVMGRADDPLWVRPALLTLLGATAVLYLWGLGASGWANSYYSAAVQAGTKSWKAFLFGSFDAGNFITVDKSPASLWPMELSARVFGVNAWSILVPQALEGVAAVGVLYAAVRRWFGATAGLIAGAVMALTPVAALMFRFNNPDALLTLMMVAAAWSITRALDDGRTRWLVLCGALLGFGFLAKELQVLLVTPGIGLAYLLAGPPKLGRRIAQLLALTATMIVAAGWWIAALMLTPASSRPYIGGSQNNSFWNVLFGYNGFGRLSGNETGSVGGRGGAQGPSWGPTGWGRMFNSQFGGQISWLLPAALVLLAVALIWTVRRTRTDRLRAAMIVWGGWLVVTGIAFSFGKGIIHEYYTVALAPAIGAVIGIVATQLWRHRHAVLARVALAVALGATVVWTGSLLSRSPQWWHGLHGPLVVCGLVLALALVALGRRVPRALAGTVAACALAIGIAAPAGASVTTAATAYRGAIPTAGPATTGGGRFGGPSGFGGGRGGFPRFGPRFGTRLAPRFAPRFAAPFTPPFGSPVASPFAPPWAGNGTNALPFPVPGGAQSGNGGALRGRFGGGGGLLDAATPSAAMTKLLRDGQHGHRWAAASIGANNAAGYQLASGAPIMAIGGFNGSDPAPTLAQFQAIVAKGEVHYFIGGGFGFGPSLGGSSDSSTISSWVAQHFRTVTVIGETVYDLTKPA